MNIKEMAVVPQWSFEAKTGTHSTAENVLNGEKRIIISGVSCSGKDFLVPRAVESLAEDQRLPMYSGGTIVSNMLGIPRDRLRYLTKDEVVSFQDDILGALPESDYIFNGHFATKHHDGTYILNYAHLKDYNPSHLIAIISEPQQIAQWRIEENAKNERIRDIESPARIHQHQQLILQMFQQVSREIGCGYTTIYNTPGSTEENVRVLTEIFRGER